jgi:hypothetical protein
MSMLTTHFSNLYMTPAIVKKLLGFKVNPNLNNSSQNDQLNLDCASGSPGSNSDCNLVNNNNNTNRTLNNPSSSLSNHNKLCEKAIRQLVKKIKKNPGALEELEKAITTRNQNTKCISIPLKSNSQQTQVLSRKTLPHVVFCRIWRWPDLQNCNELKPVTHCQHAYSHFSHNSNPKKSDDTHLVCINPYHYIRSSNNYNDNKDNNTTGQNSSPSNQSSINNLLTVYVPVTSTIAQNQGLPASSDLTPIAEDETTETTTNSTLSSTASTPLSHSHSPQQQQLTSNQISSSSSTSSYSSLQNDLTNIPQINNSVNTTNNTTNLGALSSTKSDIILNYMIGTSPPSNNLDLQPLSNNSMPNNQINTNPDKDSSNMMNYFNRSNSPHSPLGSNMASNFNMNSQSPISSASPASNSNALQQFSPFISEDDSSEINDISPSPIGSCDMMPIPMIEQPYWCSLSYYEMKQRVGEMFHVTSNVHSCTIDGYTDPSSGQRFCLGVLSNVNRTNEIEMTRHYIGRGLQLSYENGQVFAECLSENPVFVQSPNCNQRYQWHLATVVKIPPGCSLKIFDEAEFVQLANETVYQGFEAVYALTRICTIRISFVKGWGAEYRRQTILNTPCWIEVHLNNPLKLVDQILTKMGSPRTKCTSFS